MTTLSAPNRAPSRTPALPVVAGRLRGLASLRLTLGLIVVLAAAAIACAADAVPATWALALPLAGLAGNLAAAVATHPTFRRQTALLVFHLALIAVALLAAAGRLTHLRGEVELSTGEAFPGRLVREVAGPLHRSRLDRVAFVNKGFAIDYSPGMRRGPTTNRVAWRASDGTWRQGVIGDQTPLVLAGYRFYTTPNKGFAPLFEWQPAAGEPHRRGTIHLPAWPVNALRQAQQWTPPGARQGIWMLLEIEEPVHAEDAAWVFRIPDRHRLVVHAHDGRHELAPGDSVALAEGRLRYTGLTSWMGYHVFHDWTLPWLLAAGIVAAGALAWHLARRYAREPWDRPAVAGAAPNRTKETA